VKLFRPNSSLHLSLKKSFGMLLGTLGKLKQSKGLEFILTHRLLKEHLYLLLTLMVLPLIYRPLLSLPYRPGGRLADLLPFSYHAAYLQIEGTFQILFSSFIVCTFLLAVLLRIRPIRSYLFDTYDKNGKSLVHYVIAVFILAGLLYLLHTVPLREGLLVAEWSHILESNIPVPSLIISLILLGFVLSYPLQMSVILTVMSAISLMNNLGAWYPYPIVGSAITAIWSSVIVAILLSSLVTYVIASVGFFGLALLGLRSNVWLHRQNQRVVLLSCLLVIGIVILIEQFGFGIVTPRMTIDLLLQRPLYLASHFPPARSDVARIMITSLRTLLFFGLLFVILLGIGTNTKTQRTFFLLWVLYIGYYLFLIAEPFASERVYETWLSSIVAISVLTIWTLTSVLSDLLERKETLPFIRTYNAPLVAFLLVSAASYGNSLDLLSRAQGLNPPLLTWICQQFFGIPILLGTGAWVVYCTYVEHSDEIDKTFRGISSRLSEKAQATWKPISAKCKVIIEASGILFLLVVIIAEKLCQVRTINRSTKTPGRTRNRTVLAKESSKPVVVRPPSFKLARLSAVLVVMILAGASWSVYCSMSPTHYHDQQYEDLLKVDWAYYHHWGDRFGFYCRLTDVHHNQPLEGSPYVLLFDTQRTPSDIVYNETSESVAAVTTPVRTEITDGDTLIFDVTVTTTRPLELQIWFPPLFHEPRAIVNGTVNLDVKWHFQASSSGYTLQLENRTAHGSWAMYYGLQSVLELQFFEGNRTVQYFGATVWYLPFRGYIVQADKPDVKNGELFIDYPLTNVTASDKLVLFYVVDTYVFELSPIALLLSPSMTLPVAFLIAATPLVYREIRRLTRQRKKVAGS